MSKRCDLTTCHASLSHRTAVTVDRFYLRDFMLPCVVPVTKTIAFLFLQLTPRLIWNKEKGNSFVSPDDLRKDLESELRLDSNDIRSYAWFHGKIPRDLSEQLLRNDGDFLIRESISSAGEHVLTMK